MKQRPERMAGDVDAFDAAGDSGDEVNVGASDAEADVGNVADVGVSDAAGDSWDVADVADVATGRNAGSVRKLVESLRSPKQTLDPFLPYQILHETENTLSGEEKSISTIFLTNKECPFRCVFCDLWRHTLDEPTPAGAIPEQIKYALSQLPPANWIKLYNNGNFFDTRAIPVADYRAIAGLCEPFERIIVENHPKLTGDLVREFRDGIHAQLEIAMGVETIHPVALERINKGCSRKDMEHVAAFIRSLGVDLRAFILLNPPFLTDPSEIREWCLKSVRFAFENGFQTVTVIPVRSGNGMMDMLLDQEQATRPDLSMLLDVVLEAQSWKLGRVMADLWDIESFLAGETKEAQSHLMQQLKKLNNPCEVHE